MLKSVDVFYVSKVSVLYRMLVTRATKVKKSNKTSMDFSFPIFLVSCAQIIKSFFMEKSDITNKVKNVVGEVLKITPSEIGDEANFIFDLGANSMQSIQLVGAFEEEFDIELDEDKALEVQSISDAVNFISDYL